MTGAAIEINDASAADTIVSVKERVFAINPKLPVRRQRLVYRPGPRGMEALADDETLGGAGVAQDGSAELDVLLAELTAVQTLTLGHKVWHCWGKLGPLRVIFCVPNVTLFKTAVHFHTYFGFILVFVYTCTPFSAMQITIRRHNHPFSSSIRVRTISFWTLRRMAIRSTCSSCWMRAPTLNSETGCAIYIFVRVPRLLVPATFRTFFFVPLCHMFR